MKNLITALISIIFLFTSCENSTIGKYKKEKLPEGFSYNILEDNSNATLEKNSLTVEINQKLTEGQIATLAEELYNSKEEQRRFYIFYQLSDLQNSNTTWATSHFDPELDIEIIGSSSKEDENMSKISTEKVDGTIIGKWKEDKIISAIYTIYKKESKIFIQTIYKNGQIADEELTEKNISNKIRYDYKNGEYNGEYFIINANKDLEFYNSENKNFTTAFKTK